MGLGKWVAGQGVSVSQIRVRRRLRKRRTEPGRVVVLGDWFETLLRYLSTRQLMMSKP